MSEIKKRTLLLVSRDIDKIHGRVLVDAENGLVDEHYCRADRYTFSACHPVARRDGQGAGMPKRGTTLFNRWRRRGAAPRSVAACFAQPVTVCARHDQDKLAEPRGS